ncbi:LuxR C-terminal-related transcriptional regulator [Pseudonocardia acidicola]|uniref:HTH luxR-type domain-containing protein n=1 Tax=Pseudonocardia acidicola TaxID=2724939 RepID=A0ABX1S9R8_9PSEU|nr:LuxR C-terminal-related transcriptional regulator [Pseudonocardia acidicola]NMH96994.1 hypothetical protein [Pseudonocardia acidicola]
MAIPEPPVGFVGRPRVRALLDGAAGTAITLVSAPPGFGKTTALADWARCGRVRTAWLRLDEEDNDPARLWSGLLGVLPGEPPDTVDELISAVEALPRGLRLVLDNVEEIRDPEALRALRTLLRSRPPGVHLVLSGRVDPPLGLSRLRLEDRLSELRADQLQFSRTETAGLVAASGLALGPQQIRTLHEICDGWAAGLRLAAISLRDTADIDAFLTSFAADHHPLAEYLEGEVLAGLRDEHQELLRLTSICSAVPPGLAAELTDREDAPELLDDLVHRTSLVLQRPQAVEEFRTRPLLRSYLQAHLERQRPGLVAGLHMRAAGWWADRQRPLQAIEHAVRADDRAGLQGLLQRLAVPLLLTGDHRALRRALDRLDSGPHRNDPWPALASALLYLEDGDPAAAQRELATVGAGLPDSGSTELAVLRDAAEFGVAVATGEPDRARRAARRLDGVAPADTAVDALARVTRARSRLLWFVDRGSVPAELAATMRIARQHDYRYLEMQCATLAGVAAGLGGNPRAMVAESEDAAVLAGACGWQGSAWSRTAHAMLADAALLRAEPELARHHATLGLRFAGPVHPSLAHVLGVLHAAARFDLGEPAAGLSAMQQARLELGALFVPAEQVAAAALLEHRAALLLHHAAAASTVLSWLTERLDVAGELVLMRSWADTAEGRLPAARERLAPLLAGTVRPLASPTMVEARLLECRLALAGDDRPAARRALDAALHHAEALDALRPFTLAGPQVRELLVHTLGSFGTAEPLAARAVAARWPAEAPARATLLSERELTVLSLLPSLLSLDEIADDLAISINTVKSHVRAIYAKLGVSTRRTAVVTAYERALLPLQPVAGPSSVRDGAPLIGHV